jgi:hypothetical protein
MTYIMLSFCVDDMNHLISLDEEWTDHNSTMRCPQYKVTALVTLLFAKPKSYWICKTFS